MIIKKITTIPQNQDMKVSHLYTFDSKKDLTRHRPTTQNPHFPASQNTHDPNATNQNCKAHDTKSSSFSGPTQKSGRDWWLNDLVEICQDTKDIHLLFICLFLDVIKKRPKLNQSNLGDEEWLTNLELCDFRSQNYQTWDLVRKIHETDTRTLSISLTPLTWP